MSVQLAQPDFQRLVAVVQALPDFGTARDRRRLVSAALEGVPKANTVLAQLDLDGTPMGTAVEVIRFLSIFGQVAYGKEALGVLLNHVLMITGDGANTAFIRELFERYPLDSPVVPDKPITHWRGTDEPDAVQEKIIGENTLRDIFMLELALEASSAVVHLRVPRDGGKQALGTGFLIGTDLLMTNHHVIHSLDEAVQTEYTFNYQLDRFGHANAPIPARALPDGLFYTNADLDFSIIQLRDDVPAMPPLRLKSAVMRVDDRVSIIQHPGGHVKKISIQNNFVAYADRRAVQYTTSTLPGSSGSPVFDESFEVIAIHHSGGMLVDPGSNIRYLRNAGSSMVAVMEDINAHALQIAQHLKA